MLHLCRSNRDTSNKDVHRSHLGFLTNALRMLGVTGPDDLAQTMSGKEVFSIWLPAGTCFLEQI